MKYHKMEELNSRSAFFTVLEARPWSLSQQVQFHLSSDLYLCTYLCPLFFFYKNTCHIGLESIHMTSFYFDYLLKDPFQTQAHLRYAKSCQTLCHRLQLARLLCPSPSSEVCSKLMSIESMMPFNHLIPYCPLLFLPSIFPSIRVFSNGLALHNRRPKYWRFSFSIIPSKWILRVDFL